MSMIDFANESKRLTFALVFDRFNLPSATLGIDPPIRMAARDVRTESNTCSWHRPARLAEADDECSDDSRRACLFPRKDHNLLHYCR